MTAASPPRRRWFRFSLRTGFVLLTLFCIWLGWNVHQVRERESVLRYLRDPARQQALFPEEAAPLKPWRSLPFIWSVLGAQPVAIIKLDRYENSEDDCRQIQRLFPEATVMREDAAPVGGGGMGSF